jgi:molybdate transport system substrate-binding protein
LKKLSSLSWLLALSLAITLLGCGISNPAEPSKNEAQKQEIIVSAAASLKDSLAELEKLYSQKNPGVKVTFNFGGSGMLQQQIEQGAPADLFISAGKTQIEVLNQKNLLVKDSVINLLGNDLVLIVGVENNEVSSLQDLTKSRVQHVSIGTPESVPAGKYAQESLIKLNLWDTLEPKFVLAKDVTQVLNYVETGNVEAGIVYKSDAQGSEKVKVVMNVPADSHSSIVYPAGVVAASKKQQAAGDFLKYLQSPEAQQVFVKYGFSAPTK